MLKKVIANLLLIGFFVILYLQDPNASVQLFINEFIAILSVLFFLTIMVVGTNFMLDFLFLLEKNEMDYRNFGLWIDNLYKQNLIEFEKVIPVIAQVFFTVFFYSLIPIAIILAARTSFQNETITGYLPLLILGLIFIYRLFHTIDKKISDEIKSNIVSLVVIGFIIVSITGQRTIEKDTIYYSVAAIFFPLDYYFVYKRWGVKMWNFLKNILMKTFQKNKL